VLDLELGLGPRKRELIVANAGMQTQALQRISIRDADDWPVLACAMTMACPVWTEDVDFFGTGIATWTADRVALYLVG
jgi:predicted nucleic acid-binding protein